MARKIALIVGGGSGIGKATAERLAEDGFVVGVADLVLDNAKSVAEALVGSSHFAAEVDMSDEASVQSLFADVEGTTGPVSALIVAGGAPGLVDSRRPTLRETERANWDRIMAVNSRGPFLCIREMFSYREKLPVQNARIVLIASMAAQMLSVNSPPAYVASKGAVLSLTKVAAGEGSGLGVTVNAVAPGAIDTPMLRSVMPPEKDADYFSHSVAGRIGTPEEVAAAVGFLVSEASSYINGACIDVNGGMSMR